MEADALTLSELVEVGDFEGMRRRVEECGADVNERGASGGDTALHVACGRLLPNAIDWLLAHGADVNAASSATGATPLHRLAASPRARDSRLHSRVLAIAQRLLDAGADAGRPNAAGLTPMSMAPFDGFRDALRACCAVETLRVAPQLLPRLIGRGGAKLLSLRSRHGVAIDTPKQPFVAAAAADVDVAITGSRERVDAAKREIETLLARWSEADAAAAARAAEAQRAKEELAARRALDDTVTVLRVPRQQHARVAAALRALQQEFDVEITMPPSGDADDGGITVKGRQDAVAAAAERVLAVARDPHLAAATASSSSSSAAAAAAHGKQQHLRIERRQPLHVERRRSPQQQQQQQSTRKVDYKPAPRNIIRVETPNARAYARKKEALAASAAAAASESGALPVQQPTQRQQQQQQTPPLPVSAEADPTPAEAAMLRK